MIEERNLIDAFRTRLNTEPDWSEIEVDTDQLRELLELAECEVRRREDRTVELKTFKQK